MYKTASFSPGEVMDVTSKKLKKERHTSNQESAGANITVQQLQPGAHNTC